MTGRADKAATEEAVAVVSRSYSELRRFAAVAAPPEMAPDDLVHDAIASVLRTNRFDGVEFPVAYLKRTMLNLASNERRRLGRRRRAVRKLEGEALEESDAYPADLSYLAALSPNERAVLYLHYVEGDSFEAIAEDLGVRASSVRQTATRARRALRPDRGWKPIARASNRTRATQTSTVRRMVRDGDCECAGEMVVAASIVGKSGTGARGLGALVSGRPMVSILEAVSDLDRGDPVVAVPCRRVR